MCCKAALSFRLARLPTLCEKDFEVSIAGVAITLSLVLHHIPKSGSRDHLDPKFCNMWMVLQHYPTSHLTSLLLGKAIPRADQNQWCASCRWPRVAAGYWSVRDLRVSVIYYPRIHILVLRNVAGTLPLLGLSYRVLNHSDNI